MSNKKTNKKTTTKATSRGSRPRNLKPPISVTTSVKGGLRPVDGESKDTKH